MSSVILTKVIISFVDKIIESEVDMKYRELVKELEDLGYEFDRANGGHMIFSHPMGTRPVIVCRDNKEIGNKIVIKTIKKAKEYIQKVS